jgi:hypothetical protein
MFLTGIPHFNSLVIIDAKHSFKLLVVFPSISQIIIFVGFVVVAISFF